MLNHVCVTCIAEPDLTRHAQLHRRHKLRHSHSPYRLRSELKRQQMKRGQCRLKCIILKPVGPTLLRSNDGEIISKLTLTGEMSLIDFVYLLHNLQK